MGIFIIYVIFFSFSIITDMSLLQNDKYLKNRDRYRNVIRIERDQYSLSAYKNGSLVFSSNYKFTDVCYIYAPKDAIIEFDLSSWCSIKTFLNTVVSAKTYRCFLEHSSVSNIGENSSVTLSSGQVINITFFDVLPESTWYSGVYSFFYNLTFAEWFLLIVGVLAFWSAFDTSFDLEIERQAKALLNYYKNDANLLVTILTPDLKYDGVSKWFFKLMNDKDPTVRNAVFEKCKITSLVDVTEVYKYLSNIENRNKKK